MALLNYLISSLLNGICLVGLGVLPYIVLAFLMHFMSRLIRNGIAKESSGNFWIYLTSPGVAVHELGHVVFCLVFRHQITEVKLFENDSRKNRLGHVCHRYNPDSYYQRIGNFFIGTGPIWFGVACIFVLSNLLLPDGMISSSYDFRILMKTFLSGFFTVVFWLSWKTWLWIYLSFSIFAHIALSRSDLEGAADGLLLLIVSVLLCSILLGWCGPWEETVLKFELYVLITFVSMIIAFFIFFIVPLLLIRFLISKSESKRRYRR